jgi:DNA-binding NarL/FixJ family response regulator
MLAILLIDRADLFRIGLKTVIGGEFREVVFQEAAGPSRAIPHLTKRAWDLLILDADLFDQGGPALLRKVRENSPSTAVLLIGSHDRLDDAVRAYKVGASGYVPRNVRRTELLKAVRSIVNGKMHYTSAVVRSASKRSVPCRSILSAREYTVMLSLADGQKVVQIAASTGLDARTISTYKRRIFNKLALQSNADLVRYAMNQIPTDQSPHG